MKGALKVASSRISFLYRKVRNSTWAASSNHSDKSAASTTVVECMVLPPNLVRHHHLRAAIRHSHRHPPWPSTAGVKKPDREAPKVASGQSFYCGIEDRCKLGSSADYLYQYALCEEKEGGGASEIPILTAVYTTVALRKAKVTTGLARDISSCYSVEQ